MQEYEKVLFTREISRLLKEFIVCPDLEYKEHIRQEVLFLALIIANCEQVPV